MNKKVSQEEINRQLGEQSPAIELELGIESTAEAEHRIAQEEEIAREKRLAKSGGAPEAMGTYQPDARPLEPVIDDGEAAKALAAAEKKKILQTKIAKIEALANLPNILSVFLLILCVKSWWVLCTAGPTFFFKAWSRFGFHVQLYLVPNLLALWYFDWLIKKEITRRKNRLQTLNKSTAQYYVPFKISAYLLFQAPTSLFFATLGLNPNIAFELGGFMALVANIAIGITLWQMVPRSFPKLDLD